MRKLYLCSLAFIFCFASPTMASKTGLENLVPEAALVGEGRLNYMIWEVYDAALFAPKGQWDQDKPFALKLSYLRSLKGKAIADRSVEEMRKQGFSDEVKLATWHSQMREIFPDVDADVSITGIRTENGETVFYKNNEEIGRIRDLEFSKTFFNIWLSPKTSEPELRAQLLSLK